jgi:hypothetical protein
LLNPTTVHEKRIDGTEIGREFLEHFVLIANILHTQGLGLVNILRVKD